MSLQHVTSVLLIWFCVLFLIGCGADSASSQSAKQIENSRLAQSQSGDAISGKEVQVDKSTQIAQQIIYQAPAEYARDFEQRRQQGMTVFERWLAWVGSLLLFSFFSLAIIRALYRNLSKRKSRLTFIADLRSGMRRRLYRKVVKRLLRFLRRVYGRELSLQAFSVSLLLAYLYPFLLFVLAYSYFGGSPVFSGQPLLPVETEWSGVYFPALLIFGWVVYWLIKHLVSNSDVMDAWIVRRLRSISGLSETIAMQVWKVVAGIFCGGMSWFFLQPESMGWLVFWCGFGYLYGAFAVAVAVAVAVAGAGAGAGAVAILNIILGNYEQSLLFAFFYLTLPLLNASLDFLSWWVSRHFLKLTLVTKRIWLIVFEVLADAGLGIVFLLLLCLLLPPMAMGLDSLYSLWTNEQGFSAHTGWQNLAYAAARDPWGEGLLVSGMLLSTLLPTALHLVFGTAAFLVYGLLGETLADKLENSPDGARFRYSLVSLWLYIYVLLAVAILTCILWGLYQLWQMPIAESLYRFVFYWYGKYDMVPLP